MERDQQSTMPSQHLDEMASWGNAEYRIPKPLRFELVQHIGIFFEEKLCECPSLNTARTPP